MQDWLQACADVNVRWAGYSIRPAGAAAIPSETAGAIGWVGTFRPAGRVAYPLELAGTERGDRRGVSAAGEARTTRGPHDERRCSVASGSVGSEADERCTRRARRNLETVVSRKTQVQGWETPYGFMC